MVATIRCASRLPGQTPLRVCQHHWNERPVPDTTPHYPILTGPHFHESLWPARSCSTPFSSDLAFVLHFGWCKRISRSTRSTLRSLAFLRFQSRSLVTLDADETVRSHRLSAFFGPEVVGF